MLARFRRWPRQSWLFRNHQTGLVRSSRHQVSGYWRSAVTPTSMSAAQIQQLLRCVEDSTTGEDRLVRSDDAFFTFAAEPYNVRLTSSLDPVGIFYRECK